MESIELYEMRAAECLRLADGAGDATARATLLAQRKACLGIAARLRDYAAGKGFLTEIERADVTPVES
jgi:hypothetical protein